MFGKYFVKGDNFKINKTNEDMPWETRILSGGRNSKMFTQKRHNTFGLVAAPRILAVIKAAEADLPTSPSAEHLK